MLNYIWGIMILIGIIYAAFTGNLDSVTQGTMNSTNDAVNLCIRLVGAISMWTGIMKIAEKAGIIAGLTRRLEPFLNFLFPRIPRKHPAKKYIATNIIANMLGLGWAATPPGLKAMEELQKLNKDKKRASIEMCTFLIINISSVQLISINIIAYRTEYGSLNPSEIIGPSLFATLVSTLAGIMFCKIVMRGSKT
jgi:spore maturation protein A